MEPMIKTKNIRIIKAKKLIHYKNKRHGLQEITARTLKDELYKKKDLIEKIL